MRGTVQIDHGLDARVDLACEQGRRPTERVTRCNNVGEIQPATKEFRRYAMFGGELIDDEDDIRGPLRDRLPQESVRLWRDFQRGTPRSV